VNTLAHDCPFAHIRQFRLRKGLERLHGADVILHLTGGPCAADGHVHSHGKKTSTRWCSGGPAEATIFLRVADPAGESGFGRFRLVLFWEYTDLFVVRAGRERCALPVDPM